MNAPTLIDGLKPYPEYKELGQDWLGRVPAHWEVIPNRAIFDEVKDQNHPDDPMLSVTITRGVVPQKALLSETSKKDSSNQDKSKYKRVKPGDLAYNKMRAWQGAVGASDQLGIISPAYVVMRPKLRLNSKYAHFLLRTPLFAKEAERWSYGITSDMWSLRPEHFKMIYSSLPPPDEQAAIVRFLDHANRKIDRFIRGKQKLITLLNEQKQAIIHQAVTKGLDPTVPMKDSGIPWLGEIPKHWEVRRLKHLVRMRSGDFITAQLIEEVGRYPVYGGNGIRGYHHSWNTEGPVVLIGRQGALCGNVHLVDGKIWASEHALVTKPVTELDFGWLKILLQAMNLNQYSVSAAQPGLAIENLVDLPCPFPKKSEQRIITEGLDLNLIEISEIKTRTEREIVLMQEYRTRLVADVVTGKVDVRGAVFRGSEEPENEFPNFGNEEVEDE